MDAFRLADVFLSAIGTTGRAFPDPDQAGSLRSFCRKECYIITLKNKNDNHRWKTLRQIGAVVAIPLIESGDDAPDETSVLSNPDQTDSFGMVRALNRGLRA